jgi:glutaconate CoA-transferase subunit A
MGAPENYVSVDDLAARVPDGALLAIPKEEGGGALAATRALIRRGVKSLHLVCVPVGGLQADLLIGAGAVATLECSGVSLGEFGPAPRFTQAVRSGAVAIRDATCQAIYSAVQAAEKGAPFIAIRGLIGSDVLKHRADWKVIDNPFGNDDPVVVLPAIKPDIALAHARLGDRYGNVWVGERREITILAHAAQETLITVEEIYDGNLMEDERLVGNTISSLYVSAVAHAPRGAWPLDLTGRYPRDDAHIAAYAAAAKTDEGFRAYLAEHVFGTRAAA